MIVPSRDGADDDKASLAIVPHARLTGNFAVIEITGGVLTSKYTIYPKYTKDCYCTKDRVNNTIQNTERIDTLLRSARQGLAEIANDFHGLVTTRP